MMARKLAAFLSILGVIVLFTTWLLYRALELPVMPTEQVLNCGVVVLVLYFCGGLFIARVGISLVREVIADRRSREEEKRFLAQNQAPPAEPAAPVAPGAEPAKPKPVASTEKVKS